LACLAACNHARNFVPSKDARGGDPAASSTPNDFVALYGTITT
jgi:hypothetical protein